MNGADIYRRKSTNVDVPHELRWLRVITKYLFWKSSVLCFEANLFPPLRNLGLKNSWRGQYKVRRTNLGSTKPEILIMRALWHRNQVGQMQCCVQLTRNFAKDSIVFWYMSECLWLRGWFSRWHKFFWGAAEVQRMFRVLFMCVCLGTLCSYYVKDTSPE